MKKKNIYFNLWMVGLGLLVYSFSYAQTEKYAPLSVSSSFLLVSPDARASGMGDANVALSNDVSSIYWNPAGLGYQEGFQVMVTHNQWMPSLGLMDLVVENVMARYGLKEIGGIGTVGFGLTYFNQGTNTYTNSSGVDIASYLSYELCMWVSYGIEVAKGVSVGANARFITSAIAPNWITSSMGGAGTGYGFSMDLAVLWKPILPDWFANRLNIGLNISNIGPKITYMNTVSAESIPTNLKIGFAFFPVIFDYHSLVLTFDVNRLIATKKMIINSTGTTVYTSDDVFTAFATTWSAYGMKAVNFSFGFEYWYGSPKIVGFRTGFYYEDYTFRQRSPYFTFGLGLRYSSFGFDFGYVVGLTADNPYNSTFRISLMFSMDELIPKSAKTVSLLK